MRWFEYEYEATNGLALPLYDTVFFGAPPDSINISGDSGKTKADDTIYKFNTSYDFTDDIMSYLTISEGYRLGASNAITLCPVPLDGSVQNVCALPGEESYETDTSTNYEIGVHSQFGDSLLLNGAVYFVQWDDPQLQSVTANGDLPIITNGKGAESTGMELSAQYFILPNLSVSGAYAYTNAELTDDAFSLVCAPPEGEPLIMPHVQPTTVTACPAHRRTSSTLRHTMRCLCATVRSWRSIGRCPHKATYSPKSASVITVRACRVSR